MSTTCENLTLYLSVSSTLVMWGTNGTIPHYERLCLGASFCFRGRSDRNRRDPGQYKNVWGFCGGWALGSL